MLLTPEEILAIIVMTVIVGWIFSDLITMPRKRLSDIDQLIYGHKKMTNIWFAMAVTAPAIVLHEFGHKFIAMALGYTASFNVFVGGLVLAVVLKLIHAPFLILAPAYVSIPAGIPPLQSAIIAFAGPFVNLLLWLGSLLLLKVKSLSSLWIYGLKISAKINLLLFVFNLIPFPPLDGYHIFSNLFQLIF